MIEAKSLPSVERLNELLSYDPATGRLTWKVQRQCVRAGSPAGHLSSLGYFTIKIDGVNYKSHRIIWKMIYGSDPEGEIDHANGNRAENTPENLREATRLQNMANRKMPIVNSSGVKGLCIHKKTGKWYAQIQAAGQKIYVGLYDDKGDAQAAINAARDLLHGDFARSA